MYEYHASLIRVIDGDTVALNVDLGMRVHVEVPVRLAGLNAAELNSVAGQAARDAVAAWFNEGPPVVTVRTEKSPEKYGRWLASIWRAAESHTSLNAWLVANGHAKLWDGRGERP